MPQIFNPITLIDGYKFGHRKQEVPGTENVLANFTPRGSRTPDVKHVVFAGLQYVLKRYLMDEIQEGFFDKPLEEVVTRYAKRTLGYLGPNNVGVDHIIALHKLGYLPLELRAVPEGTEVPLRVPMFTVTATNPEFSWLVNYYETLISDCVWPMSTSATTAKRLKKLFLRYAKETGTDPGFVQWQGHDFSMRGMMGPEAAAISGTGHLMLFSGTDTVPAIDLIEYAYAPSNFIAGSVAATEHSISCAGGKEHEFEMYERMLEVYPSGIVSIVSDTWDLWNVLTNFMPRLRDRIMARDGKIVIRPDSGDPVKIICGDPDAPVDSPAYKGVVELLYEVFGGTKTSTGHILLDSHIGCIYGDSITHERAQAIFEGLKAKWFASGNVVLGIGSFTYTYTTRDQFSFAMKTTWTQRNGVGYDMFKDPVTDDGTKKSSIGRLSVLLDGAGEMYLVSRASPEQELKSLLRPVWCNGKFLVFEDFNTIRERVSV